MSPRQIFPNLARAALATVVALPLASAVITLGIAQSAFNEDDFATAATFNPLSTEARSALAAARAEHRMTDAETYARQAIGLSPLNADAAATIGFLKNQRQGAAAAEPFMSAAAAMSWANQTAQLWMLHRANSGFRFEEAVLRTDALLRQRLQRDQLFGYLRGLTVYPAAIEPLARRLALRPRWRGDYLQDLETLTPEQLRAHPTLLMKLREIGGSPSEEEVDAYVARLASAGAYQDAWSAWLRLAGRRARDARDGRFSRLNAPGAGSPFEWKLTDTTGVLIRTEPSRGSGQVPLRVSASGMPSGPILERMLVLSAGLYRLIHEAQAAESTSLNSLAWQLTCLGDQQPIDLAPSRTFTSAERWQRREWFAMIPPGCMAQRLQLVVDHDEPRDLDVRIRPVQLQRLN